MGELFQQVDTDDSGTISLEEFEENLRDENVLACFSVVQIEVSEARGLFQLLDINETGEVDIEEFIVGCCRLHCAAQSIEMAAELYENKRNNTRWTGLISGLAQGQERLMKNVDMLREQLTWAVVAHAPQFDSASGGPV